MENKEAFSKLKTLSKTEATILYLKCSGFDYEDIGLKLGYAIPTIQLYASTMYQKLGIEKSIHSSKRKEILQREYCPAIIRFFEGEPVMPPDDPQPDPPASALLVVMQEYKEEQEKRLALRPPDKIIVNIPPEPVKRDRIPWWIYLIIALLSIVVLYLLKINQDLTIPNPIPTPIPTIISTLTARAAAIIPTDTPTATLIPTIVLTETSTITPTTTPTFTLTPTVSNTPTDTPTLTPTQVVLWHAKFSEGMPTDWNVLTPNVIKSIVDGDFVSTGQFTFSVGDETWKNYLVRVNFVTHASCTFARDWIGLRATSLYKLVSAWMCYEDVGLHLDNKEGALSGSAAKSGSVFEIKAEGNYFRYSGKEIYQEGYPHGYVIFSFAGGTHIKEIEIIQLP